MKKLLLLSLIFTFVFISNFLRAEIVLPAIFGSNMVLQQQTDAAIWGKATKNKTVEIVTSWNNKSYSAESGSDGMWKVKVSTPVAGGPFSITISDGKKITLENVLIGEVWLCSGQSNMEMPVKGYFNQPVLGSNKTIATSSNKNIRLITVKRNKSLNSLNNFEGSWSECEPQNVANFSATAYYFGKMLQQVLGVPVGLINSSWGGTRIEPWMSEAGLKKFDFVNLPDKTSKEDFSQQTPTVLFNAMIAPFVGYGMRGAIWYQGESNRNQPAEYEKLMQGLIENWRNEWNIGEFPFYFCQIAPFGYNGGVNTAFLREAQLKTAQATPNAGMACLMDIGEQSCIHPAHKETTGNRLAYLALAKTYGFTGFACESPVLKEMTIEGSTVNLTFNNADNGLTTFGKPLTNFSVAGENKRFYPANAVLTRKGILLSSPQVEKPVAVRYAWQNFVVGELFNTAGLPASSFRTDDWEAE